MRRSALWLAPPALAVLLAGGQRYRRWHLRWGATDAEVDSAMPGDDLLPRAAFDATRAVTIDASPGAVWPWLLQVGFGRAGFYSYDLLDNLGRPSADQIRDEWQEAAVGDWIPMSGNVTERTAFRVHSFERPRWMLWTKPDSSWSWRLEPRGDDRTRLITRLRCRYDWHDGPGLPLTVLLMELADFPMMRRMLLGVKQRAEQLGDA